MKTNAMSGWVAKSVVTVVVKVKISLLLLYGVCYVSVLLIGWDFGCGVRL